MRIELINKNKLKPDKGQPRKTFNLGELAASIKESGIMVPLIITPDYQILDGERRWRASKEIKGLNDLPCVIIEKKEYEKPDKRLELQLITNEMSEKYNVVEKAEAYQRYLDAGHSHRELAKLLGKGKSTVGHILSLLSLRGDTLENLRKNDSNWTFHARIEEALNDSLPKIQKDRIHQRVEEGAFSNRDELEETLDFAKSHPVQAEKVLSAKDNMERGLVMLNARPVEKKEYKPKRKMTQEEIERVRFIEMIQALNSINNSRILWAMSGAVDIVNRIATSSQKKEVIKSIETIIGAWTKTLKELQK